MARPTKLTSAVQTKILQAVRAGAFREVAARFAGVAPETLSRWMSRDGAPYTAFRQALLDAEAAAEISAVAQIIKQGQTDPKHLEWWLERKFPERWGRRDRVEVQLRHDAERIAGSLGLDVDELIATAEAIAYGSER